MAFLNFHITCHSLKERELPIFQLILDFISFASSSSPATFFKLQRNHKKIKKQTIAKEKHWVLCAKGG